MIITKSRQEVKDELDTEVNKLLQLDSEISDINKIIVDLQTHVHSLQEIKSDVWWRIEDLKEVLSNEQS